mgnify:CR=1 FL=1
MMRRTNVVWAVLILLLWSCSKEAGVEENHYSDQPLFYLNAVVDGLPISLKAGENQYQMYTGYTLQDSVLHMQGVLASDSPNFRNAFYIDLRAAELVANLNQLTASRTFTEGPLPLADPSGLVVKPDHYDYRFFADNVNGHIPTMWAIEDTSYYGDSCALLGLDATSKTHIEVVMTSTGPLSCTPSVKHIIKTHQDCKGELHILQNSNSGLIAEARARLGKLRKVDWYLGGQKVSSGLNFNYSPLVYQPSYLIRAELEFESGCTESIEKLVLPGGSTCDINIDYLKTKHRVANPHNLKTVEIRYYDAQGKMYSSWYPKAEGSFSIESYNSYHDANSSQPHQRFSFSGEAILKSADGASIKLNSIFGIFALAHP